MKLPSLRHLADKHGLTLVSGSPRRKRILTEVGISFEIVVPQLEEIIIPGFSPHELVMDLARQKVDSVSKSGIGAYLGCDTIVVLEGEILTKPLDAEDAMHILKKLSGRQHSVFSGLTLFDNYRKSYYRDFEESRVFFNNLEEKDLAAYIASGEPLDKAGAYGIQGMGGFLVDSVEGNIDNVIGLPMGALEKLAARYREKYV